VVQRVLGGVGDGGVEVELGRPPGQRLCRRGLDPALVGLDVGELGVGAADGREPSCRGGDRRVDLVQLAQVVGPLPVGELPRDDVGVEQVPRAAGTTYETTTIYKFSA
jgi:hypothetical protein